MQKQEARRWYCPHCKQDYYDNPRPCADLVLFNEKGEVLLSKRAVDPGKGKWDMPGGFIEYGETADEAVLREAKEELDINPGDFSEPKYVMSYAAKYPWGKEVYDIVVSIFVVQAKNDLVIKPQDDVADAKWVLPDKIDVSELSNPKFKDFIITAYDILHT